MNLKEKKWWIILALVSILCIIDKQTATTKTYILTDCTTGAITETTCETRLLKPDPSIATYREAVPVLKFCGDDVLNVCKVKAQ